MTHPQAIEFMSQSTSIRDWNNRREVIKEEFGVITDYFGQLLSDGKEFLKSPIPYIDSYGLISKLFKK